MFWNGITSNANDDCKGTAIANSFTNRSAT